MMGKAGHMPCVRPANALRLPCICYSVSKRACRTASTRAAPSLPGRAAAFVYDGEGRAHALCSPCKRLAFALHLLLRVKASLSHSIDKRLRLGLITQHQQSAHQVCLADRAARLLSDAGDQALQAALLGAAQADRVVPPRAGPFPLDGRAVLCPCCYGPTQLAELAAPCPAELPLRHDAVLPVSVPRNLARHDHSGHR